ncbi:unnamed protein product [Rotaria magnacalcarata]|uniref:WD repeat-containing protein 90 n=1 Tax=Rotaria magnacalcarata TaxID=392030 RepID=A0A8S2KDM7_9BILA|nr:unnamed protein product [Rotaria magnacalcarata]
MNNSTWQHPYVNIFKHFDIGSTKKCTKQGDVTALMDRDLKSTVFRIRGLVPANNYIQFPAQSSNQTLALTGHLFYALFRPIFDKFFSIHIDILTHEQHLVRISLSNLYREFKVTQTSIQFPYTSPNTTMHWTVLCFDLESILLTYMTNQHYHMIKSFQLCGNMMVKNCFSSKYFYDSGLSNQKMKQSSNRALPRELSYPVGKDESWHEKYDFIMIPNSSLSIVDENSNDLSSKIGSVQVHSARDSSRTDDTMNQSFTNSIQNTISPRDNQNNWQQSITPVDGFPSLPTMPESSTSTNHNNDGIHLFINPQSIPSNNSMNDDFNFDLALTTDRSQLSHLPDPILRLRTVIGLGNRISSSTSLLWTQDGNYVLYPSNAIVVQMHVETQQQWFFIGHTDKVSAIAFNGNSSLLATTQTGPSGILRLWKFETRRCICVVRVPGTSNLHALDFGIRNLSDSSSTLVVVGHGEQPQQSRTIVCVYNTLNALKGSIDLLCRSATDASISHIRFVPYDSTRFLSIGSDNIRFWRIKNGNDLKSMSISVDDIEQLEYTDLQFEHLSNNKLNELVVYVSSKSGHIIELLYDERRVVKIHRLLPVKRSNGSTDKITMANGPSIGICAFTCTSNFSITGSNDGYVRVWSNDFAQVYIEAKHDQAICGLVTSHDQTRVLILTVSGSLGVLNLVNKEHTNLIRAHTQNVTDIDYDDTRKQMISVGHDGTIRIWCFRTGKQLSEFTAERETPAVVTYAPNRQTFACGFDNGTIKVFELNTSIISAEIAHHTKGITGLLYAHNGGRLISSDEEGTLCLLDANDSYKLQRTVAKALSTSQKGTMILSISPDGKHTAYVGPTEYVVTIVETNSLNQTLRIDISSCTLITNDRRSITSTEAALFARFAPNRQLLVATTNFKLLKFDSYTGKLLNIINNIHKRTFDCLTLSSDSQYLVTGGDNMIKFWDDANFQSFVGHSEPIQKVFFTDDNMHLVSIGDSIFIWDVLAWTTPRPGQLNNTQSTLPSKMLERVPSVLSILDNSGQPRNPPEPFQYSQQNNGHTARAITRSLSNSEIDKNTNVSQGQKKTNNKKSSKKQTDNPPAIRRHFIQRVNHSHLAKLVLCSTNCGFVTCWNTRTNSCLLHWKADSNEICYMTAIKYKLLTGSSSGCLRLWNIENLEVNLGQTKNNDSNYGLTIQDEFQLDDGIISGSFDDIFDMGIVGTSCGSLWYICWTTERSKTRLVASHTDRITGVIPIEDTHIVTSSLDGTIRIFQLEDRNEILRFDANGLKVTCMTSWDNSIVPTTDTSVTTSPIKNIRTTIRSIVAGYNDGTLRIFNLLHGQMVLKLHPHTSSTTAINVPSNTTISISGASDGSVAISNLVQGLVLRVLNEHRGNAPICVIDSKQSLENNSYIWLIVSHDRRISLWKSNQQFDLCQLIDWLTFSAPSFAPDGTTIQNNNWESYPPSLARFIDRNLLMYIGYGIEKSIQIYNLDTKQITRTIPLNQWCSCFDISNIKNDEDENHLIAIGTKDRLVQLKDYTQGTFQDFIGSSDTILNIKFLRKNSNDLLITTSSNEIFLWNVLLN